MAEAVLREVGGAAFEVESAGTHPRGVNPLTVRALAEAGVSRAGLRSKDVVDYLGREFDWVITVCDRAREACPVFPGAQRSIHWGLDDPAEVTGDDDVRFAAFQRVLAEVTQRVRLFVPLAEREAASRGPVAIR
jgi:arsenate reductase